MAKFLGLRLDPLSMEQTLECCETLILQRNKQHVVLNAAKVVQATEDKQLAQIINKCDLVNADGMSVVWAARLLGIPVPERVAGIDLMYALVELSAKKGYSIYLLGAEDKVLARTRTVFESSGANISGARNGFWNTSDEQIVVREIADNHPDILFLAIPSPKKEIFLAANLEKLGVGLVMGVGGSFDVVAGKTRRAPKFAQRWGLEWIFRLFQEPKRMLKRYLVGNSKFLYLVLREIFHQFLSRTKRG